MQRNVINLSRNKRRSLRKQESGVALLTTLLLLLLLTGLSLAMVISVRSDLLVNGYYRNFRGAFYAADSGLNIVRQQLVNQLSAAVPATVAINTQPIPAGTEANVVSSVNTSYGTNYTITGSGATSGSWPESFHIDTNVTNLTLVSCLPQGTGAGGTCPNPTGNPSSYQYQYSYSLSAIGQAQGGEKATITDSGNLTLLVSTAAGSSSSSSTTTQSFASWGMFIDQQNICSGSILVPGTISGPVFTNGSWTFGDTGKYIFTDSVGSAGANGGFQFSGGGPCDQLNAATDTNGATTIAPTFNQGFNRGQPSVPLPPNDFNQQRAVLDGKGMGSTAVSNTERNAALKNISKTAYPSGGATSGVYLPYKTVDALGNAIAPTLTGGGIYVEGNATVTLSPSGTNGQIYTIVNNGVTTTITITPGTTPGTGTTVVQSGSTTLNITGVPSVQDSSSNPTSDATMLYVNGSITALKGPGEGLAAVNDGTALTVTAANSVAITGDILYKSEPVTLTASGSTPADTLIPANDHKQVLGIFTASGDIQLNNQQSDRNLQIDASLATISQGGTGGLTNIGSSINNLNIVGGRIQNNIKNIGATTRNVFFDRRFAANGFAPPWFPSTTVATTTTTTVANNTTSVGAPNFSRVQWLYKSNL
jgi:Tfp pilus assembly protein PilX